LLVEIGVGSGGIEGVEGVELVVGAEGEGEGDSVGGIGVVGGE
jgi:hypothetical protein